MRLWHERHYDPPEWVDYLRGHLTGLAVGRMRAHLREGCGICRKTVGSLLAVMRDAAAESGPPDHAVRGALAVFSAARPASARGFRRLPVEIGFDSLLETAPAGVRQVESQDRRLVLNAGRFTVDTRIDQSEDPAEMSIVGQIVNRSGFPVPDVPAFLASGGEVISSGSTSSLGEFQMTCAPRRRLRLCLAVGGADLVELSLCVDAPWGDDTQVAG